MVRVKVCGLTSPADVATVVDAGVDAIGAIVDVPVETPREIEPERASRLFAAAPPFVSTVLVTMPETVADAVDLADAVGPDALQIHGGLDPGEIDELAGAVDADVIVGVDAEDPDAPSAYADAADAILADSTDDSGAGGTGRTHDWERTRQLRETVDAPLVLAGGLTPDIVGTAIERVEPYAVDVASGVEAEAGSKDPDAVAAFVRAARSGEP
ncbi:phosphoribosylanthranilate isomerase [Halanaeroarchaeum sulfurireducens]|uniref:N-(5'-phosphoribosyl)anthranilate isomerase n=1 Tax=Halanaeroarchaeum sulfurireducens TaxID=1604004 RepID=A0A0F7PG23_9EURY|nr:phosphoribosylanthranilate isomerase [Halanaeroarchaeum sulfurireducens]AKH98213.1 phosphoribosylanthranilate isomerase [Halanaeroarchaeum sulfurireducens]